MGTDKRRDVQRLRGIAIIYVPVFHLYPELFPYGFLGVDIFFVISGYLMAMILLKEEVFTLTGFLIYKKRVKRIFPAYYLVLFLILLSGYFLLASNDYTTIRGDCIWAAGFATNIHKYLQNLDYFTEVAMFVRRK